MTAPTAHHDPIIGAAEAALRRCAQLLRPEQRDHAIAEARAAFVRLRRYIDEMREQGCIDETAMLRMAGCIAGYRNGTTQGPLKPVPEPQRVSDLDVLYQFKDAQTEDAWTRKP